MGFNSLGQLGDGTTTDRSTPVQVASGVAAVAAGGAHSLYLKTDGTMWAMGDNAYGQFGDGTTTNRSTPVQVASGVAAAAAGGVHSFYLKTDGTLWAMGWNNNGQLGDGTTTDRSSAVQVASGVAAVAAGGAHSLYRKTDGTLWAMGWNNSGQLGDGTTTNRSTPVRGVLGVTPAITTQPSSQTINAGNSVTFTAAAGGNPTPTYQWRKDTVKISGATSATYTIATVATGDAGSYTVTVTNSAGSVTSGAAALTVNVTAPSFTTQPISQTGAVGGNVTFAVVASGTAPLAYP